MHAAMQTSPLAFIESRFTGKERDSETGLDYFDCPTLRQKRAKGWATRLLTSPFIEPARSTL